MLEHGCDAGMSIDSIVIVVVRDLSGWRLSTVSRLWILEALQCMWVPDEMMLAYSKMGRTSVV